MLFPRRWQMIFFLTSAAAIAYIMRVNVSVAAVEIKDSLEWPEYQKSLLLSSYYIGRT